ncbi:MAG TPA: class I SAM-dependent methyltransferase [Tessaracoccus flavescens]|uniref:Class I SAM-dependent methyltransferase n=1 Tax=Tessaracoccus flavescens TaxID=399497 RepID=A0A921ERS2_9ACTN|nr:class I SAM-dependent methyltransferase [Tessaracoccus flavescens]
MTHDWDATYSEADRIWSGQPNKTLVAEVTGLETGRALDVGCGEGADAIWLEQRGWEVVGVDPSLVALERAQRAADEADVEVEWVHGSLDDVVLPHDDFDLVSVHYAPIFLDQMPLEELTRLVAVGGTLLVVHHAEFHAHPEHGDITQLLTPDNVAARLGDDWRILVHEHRDRDVVEGRGAHHHEDVVLRAVRVN